MLPPDLSRLAAVGTEVARPQGPRRSRCCRRRAASGVSARRRTRCSPLFIDLLIAVEDRRFWHASRRRSGRAGCARPPDAARRASVVSGGSTLAMQAARLLRAASPHCPRPSSSRWPARCNSRAHTAGTACWTSGSPWRPFGGNLEGVRAGSLAWFGVPARGAGASPGSPAGGDPSPARSAATRPPRCAARAVAATFCAVRVGQADQGSRASTRTGARAGVPRHKLPRHAPQLAASLPRPPRVQTTLDLPLQTALERLAGGAAGDPAAAGLARHADGRCTLARGARPLCGRLARPGSRAGALDLTRAVRSPGSALKPFIYAMAFADGIAGAGNRVPTCPAASAATRRRTSTEVSPAASPRPTRCAAR